MLKKFIKFGAATVISVLLSAGFTSQASAVAFTGGMLNSSFTMTAENSPYTITSTIQIPLGVTLTVEPGVTINAPGLDKLFWINGSINLAGTSTAKIRIKGSPSNYFYLEHAQTASVVIKHTLINGKGIGSLIPATGNAQHASFLVEDSEFIDIPGFNYLWYPLGATFSRNVFKGLGGFGSGTDTRNITFQDNLFIGDASDYYGSRFWIEGWANYRGAVIGVYGNEFRDTTVNVLTGKVNISATGNYWGTTDLLAIAGKVADRNDSLSYAGTVDFSSPLSSRGTSPADSLIISQGPTEITGGTVSISGIPKSGNTLTATPSNFDPTNCTFTYQWKRDGINISGATSATYLLALADVGKQMSVSVTGSYASLPPVSVTSSATSSVLAPDPIRAGYSSFSGTFAVGNTVRVDTRNWSPSGVTFTYSWRRGGVPIQSATGQELLLTSDDIGNYISVVVTGSMAGLNPASSSITSTIRVASAPLRPVSPTIWGVARVGSTLTVVAGNWGHDNVFFTYEWLRNGSRIPGATGLSYKLTSTDLNSEISVRVSGSYPDTEPAEEISPTLRVLAALETRPVISSISTTSTAEGKTLIIRGQNLKDVDSVLFTGGVEAKIISQTETSITVQVPSGAESGKVTVASLDGSAQSATLKIVKPKPSVKSFTPVSGKVGTKITVSGINLTSVNKVLIGGVSVPFTKVSKTKMYVSVTSKSKTGKLTFATSTDKVLTTKTFIRR